MTFKDMVQRLLAALGPRDHAGRSAAQPSAAERREDLERPGALSRPATLRPLSAARRAFDGASSDRALGCVRALRGRGSPAATDRSRGRAPSAASTVAQTSERADRPATGRARGPLAALAMAAARAPPAHDHALAADVGHRDRNVSGGCRRRARRRSWPSFQLTGPQLTVFAEIASRVKRADAQQARKRLQIQAKLPPLSRRKAKSVSRSGLTRGRSKPPWLHGSGDSNRSGAQESGARRSADGGGHAHQTDALRKDSGGADSRSTTSCSSRHCERGRRSGRRAKRS